jgi:hypothetical protein
MIARELVAGWRAVVGDQSGARWPDAEVYEYLNEGHDEASLRNGVIVDGKTPEVAFARFAPGDDLIPLHAKVLTVRQARLVNEGRRVFPMPLAQLADREPDWPDKRGRVDFLVTDHTSGFLRPYRIPEAGDTLAMVVVRMPLAAMGPTDEPEIRPQLHRALREWISYRAFLKPETRDAGRAMEAFAAFEQAFGPRRGGL